MSLEQIAALSREMGKQADLVLAGGGNSSWKDEQYLYIKPSGVALAALNADDFVKLDRTILSSCLSAAGSVPAADCESTIRRYIDFSVLETKNGRRPSVEAVLHVLFPQKFVMHLHPTLVNAMTCGKNGAEVCAKLFPDALWIPSVNPGATLAAEADRAMQKFAKSHGGKAPAVLFCQNHGLFIASDDVETIKTVCADILTALTNHCQTKGIDLAPADGPESDADFVRENGPVLRGLLTANGCPAAVCALPVMSIPEGAFTPDHVVYSGAKVLVTDAITKEAVDKFISANGCLPQVVLVPGKALFAAGKDVGAMRRAVLFIRDSAMILKLSAAFGGPNFLPVEICTFIRSWNMEAYRLRVANTAHAGQLSGKIALVTGGAQGFGYGISEALIKEGAHVIVADLNAQGAAAAAEKLGPQASSLAVDVSNEESIAALADAVIRDFGGLDLFVSNAGVLKAGSVKSFEKRSWDFVTSVNYTGYFLCVKHFTPMMARQNAVSGLWTDFVQVNSKSGLVGSNKNAAYAAGKFGTIGMTQSFALELVEDHIKVNSVCPGNYYDGPLWSDPERGLFRQYFDSGKVPGAKTLQDVKDFYLSKSPIRRGCFPADVAKAIVYACSQQFETGQAIPVTGGQVMLN